MAAVAAGVLLAWGFSAERVRPGETTEPVRVHFSQLPTLVYARSQFVGQRVRVAFYRPLTPTDDATVYHFHPGEPVQVTPATYRLHFVEPPTFGSRVVVVGTVGGVEPDFVKRLNAVPGVLVLTDCRALADEP